MGGDSISDLVLDSEAVGLRVKSPSHMGGEAAWLADPRPQVHLPRPPPWNRGHRAGRLEIKTELSRAPSECAACFSPSSPPGGFRDPGALLQVGGRGTESLPHKTPADGRVCKHSLPPVAT